TRHLVDRRDVRELAGTAGAGECPGRAGPCSRVRPQPARLGRSHGGALPLKRSDAAPDGAPRGAASGPRLPARHPARGVARTKGGHLVALPAGGAGDALPRARAELRRETARWPTPRRSDRRRDRARGLAGSALTPASPLGAAMRRSEEAVHELAREACGYQRRVPPDSREQALAALAAVEPAARAPHGLCGAGTLPGVEVVAKAIHRLD